MAPRYSVENARYTRISHSVRIQKPGEDQLRWRPSISAGRRRGGQRSVQRRARRARGQFQRYWAIELRVHYAKAVLR